MTSMNLKRFLSTMLLFCGALFTVYSQQVTGNVTDEADGLPIIGAVIQVKGTNKGAITDLDGNYSIDAKKSDVLEFSYVGMTSQNVTVGTSPVINIAMKSATNLDEIVVVGYGAVKKRDLTGSVASLKSEDLMKNRPVTVEQGLQGRLAGVNIIRNDGAPGGGMSMQIRGTNSFMGGTEPLYVIDGVPLSTNNAQESVSFNNDKDVSSRNALSFLDPNDIESIEVLKDGSSIAIYGSKGANGVVMVTTKSGKAGKDKIEVGLNTTVSNVAKKLKMMGARDYALYQNESYINTQKLTGTYDPAKAKLPYPGKDNDEGKYQLGPDDFGNDPYYWQDQVFRTAVSKNANVTFSGGAKGYDYSIGASYLDQEGTVKNSDYQRVSLRLSLNKEIRSWLKIGTSTIFSTADSRMLKTATKNQNNGDEGVIRSALYYPPTYLADGSVELLDDYKIVSNPVQYTQAQNKNKNYSVFTSNYINATLTKGLIYRMVLGYNMTYNNSTRYFPRYLQEGRQVNGRSEAGDNTWASLTWDNLLMYNYTIDKHNISGTFGTSWEDASWYNKRVSVEGFGTDANNGVILGEGKNPQIPFSNKGDVQNFSLIFRGSYNYASKYYLTLTARYDASSKFAENHKSAFFPSIGGSWRISEENFLKDVSAISNFKLRYSFGSSGNSGIGPYGSLPLFMGSNYPIGGGVTNGYAPDPYNPGNPDLKWETTRQHDAGIDLTLFNRIELTLDYYNKKTSDLLQQVEQPASTGIVHIMRNLGDVRNEGWELALNARLITTTDFTWNAGFNISKNKNTLLSVSKDPNDKVFPNKLWNDLRPFVMTKGQSIGRIYGFVEEGIWNTREEVINSKQFQTSGKAGYKVTDNDPVVESLINQKWLGEIRYADLDDSGYISDEDQTYIGDTNPDFIYGFNMDFSFKKFDFSFLFSGIQGNDIINMPALRFHDIGGTRNMPKDIYEGAWTAERYGPNPKNVYDNSRKLRLSRRFIEDGSYLKLRNVTLGYTISNPIKGISSVRVFVTGTNLLTFTNYSGYDPEINSFGSDPAMRGVDAGGYPQSRDFTLGVNLSF